MVHQFVHRLEGLLSLSDSSFIHNSECCQPSSVFLQLEEVLKHVMNRLHLASHSSQLTQRLSQFFMGLCYLPHFILVHLVYRYRLELLCHSNYLINNCVTTRDFLNLRPAFLAQFSILASQVLVLRGSFFVSFRQLFVLTSQLVFPGLSLRLSLSKHTIKVVFQASEFILLSAE